MSIVAIIQARMSSSRLPGKVLEPILGKSMLLHLVDRVKQAKYLNNIVVATSTDITDDPIYSLCSNNDIECSRGDLLDVLSRYYYTAVNYHAQHIVRITADCPLIDPGIIDQLILLYQSTHCDYASNTLDHTCPDGLDVEIFSFEALERAYHNAILPSEREHVTPYLYKHSSEFRLASLKNDPNHAHYRLTVDYMEDLSLVREIYHALYPHKIYFDWKDILSFLEEHPSLIELNSAYKRGEGYQKSLLQDKEVKYAEDV